MHILKMHEHKLLVEKNHTSKLHNVKLENYSIYSIKEASSFYTLGLLYPQVAVMPNGYNNTVKTLYCTHFYTHMGTM